MPNGTLGKTCDGNGSCGVGGGPQMCSPFMCNGTTSCLLTCTTNTDCVSPNTCVGNTCGKKPAGARCTSTAECDTNLSCTDGFCCTSAACGACKACNATGSCQNNDGSACTVTDKCHVSDGTCMAGACSSTKISCDDNNDCTMDTCDLVAGCQNMPLTGTSCNDNNSCTQTDTCQAGVCTGSNQVSCPGATNCRGAQKCNSATGACEGATQPDGTACDDGNKCNTGDTCQAGVCTAGSTVVMCPTPLPCHLMGACIPSSGMCTDPLATNGSTCQDPNKCILGESCQNGSCTGGTMKTCNNGDQCNTAGMCDPSTGTCPPPSPKPDNMGCEDGNLCTLNDSCQGGVCTPGTQKPCPGDQCNNAGVCANGACPNLPKDNGTLCEDGKFCTAMDTCQAGLCVPGLMSPCDPVLETCSESMRMCVPNM
jgi:hypothetical protein